MLGGKQKEGIESVEKTGGSDIINMNLLMFAEKMEELKIGVDRMNESEFQYIIARVIDNANDALKEAKENPESEFYEGKKLAYYETLDTIKNELMCRADNWKSLDLMSILKKCFCNIVR